MVFDVHGQVTCGRYRYWPWLVALLLVLPSGCDPGRGPERGAVHGRVTVAGQPVESGSIRFIPTDGNSGPTAGEAIENGNYSIPADRGPVLGPNRVEIRGTRKTGRKAPDPAHPNLMMEEIVEVVPARYNTNSSLVREVGPGKNLVDFKLESK